MHDENEASHRRSISIRQPKGSCSPPESESTIGSWPSYFGQSLEPRLLTSPPSRPPRCSSAHESSYNMQNTETTGLLSKSEKDLQEWRFRSFEFKPGSGEDSFECQRTVPKDHSHEENHPASRSNQSTDTQALLNAVNILLGVGVLSLPYGFRCSGLCLGLVLLVAFSLLTNYTGKLLGRCIASHPSLKTYPDIGEAAFGTQGRIFISIMFFTELFTACTMFLILVGDNLARIFPAYSEVQLMVLATLVIVPTTWTTHFGFLSYFSILGILSSLFLLLVILWTGAAGEPGGLDSPLSNSYLHPPSNIDVFVASDHSRIPLSIGLIMVGYAGHAVFPSIYDSMARKASYPRVLNRAYVLVAVVYGTIAICGYLMFGHDTTKEITLNLMDMGQNHWLTTAVTWTIALNPATKFALTINPVALSVEELVLPARYITTPSAKAQLLRGVIRTVLTITSLVCAVSIPYFERVTSFLGSLSAMLISAIVPCLCYVKLFRGKLSSSETWGNLALVAVCLVLATIGTLASFLSPS